MGGLLAFRVGNFDNTAEREQFRFLCEKLKAHYENSNDFCVFLASSVASHSWKRVEKAWR